MQNIFLPDMNRPSIGIFNRLQLVKDACHNALHLHPIEACCHKVPLKIFYCPIVIGFICFNSHDHPV